VRDWCVNVWKQGGPPVEGGRLVVDAAAPDDEDFRAVRGGAWNSTMPFSRTAARFAGRPGLGWPVIGFRVTRAVPAGGKAQTEAVSK
jgi:serine/threonine-protein kinase